MTATCPDHKQESTDQVGTNEAGERVWRCYGDGGAPPHSPHYFREAAGAEPPKVAPKKRGRKKAAV